MTLDFTVGAGAGENNFYRTTAHSRSVIHTTGMIAHGGLLRTFAGAIVHIIINHWIDIRNGIVTGIVTGIITYFNIIIVTSISINIDM